MSERVAAVAAALSYRFSRLLGRKISVSAVIEEALEHYYRKDLADAEEEEAA